MPAPSTSGESATRRFQFRECLGRGGFGEVYRAVMYSPGGLQSDVAVKILRDADQDAIRRLRDEGRLLATLRHPAILRAHDLAVLDGRVALVTEYVEGVDLAGAIGPGGLSPRALIEVVGTVAEALNAARTTESPEGAAPVDLVHRDIKPTNLRIGRHGEVKVLDFGIAWSQTPDREAKTRGGSTVGSLPYMAPERFGRGAVKPACDIYALGCTLYEGLVGDRLFPDPTPVEMFQRAASVEAHDAYVAARFELLGAVDPDVRELLAKMLCHDATQRPTAAEVARACDRLADGMPGPRLRAWVRDRAWTGAQPLSGGLTGRVVSEQLSMATGDRLVADATANADTIDIDLIPVEPAQPTLGPPAAAPPSPPAVTAPTLTLTAPVEAPAHTHRRLIVAVGAGAVALCALIIAALVGSGAVSLQRGDPPPPIAVEPPTLPIAPVVAEPAVVAAPAAVIPAAEPAPVAPVAVAPPRETPKPVVVAPRPVEPPPPAEVIAAPPPPEPPPAPIVDATPATVRVVGEAKVELRAGSATFGPGKVPPGKYAVWVDFGYGASEQTRIDLPAGGAVTLRCNALRATCDLEY